jgi:hypothetical protein
MRLGITVSPVPELSINQCLADIKEKKVNILPAVSLSPERHAYFSFSNDLIRIPRVITTLINRSEIYGMNDLIGRSVAAVRNSAISGWVAQGYQGMLAVEYDETQQAIEAGRNSHEACS